MRIIDYNKIMDTVDSFLALYAPGVREIALRARTLIQDVIPDAIEQVDTASKIIAYGYARDYKSLICAIAPQKSYVNLMFARGADLPDPAGLLEGTGKRARHVKLATPAEADNQAVRILMMEAVRLANP